MNALGSSPRNLSWRVLLMIALERTGDPEAYARTLAGVLVESNEVGPNLAEFAPLFPELAPPPALRLVGSFSDITHHRRRPRRPPELRLVGIEEKPLRLVGN